ncbi:integrase catalytic domain-containing protein [Nephila pilipes]|uniref:Integrase catalytic domain-containing protein n=1 Tax=Nephila pilipes TaxID=299642 RepID=A0A8X6P246_NEPPI|nr:integrase catalytic domain-containing protein [Nephila pilipes]
MNGVLQVTGRLGKSTHLFNFEKHPIVFPSKAKLTGLLIWESHQIVFHSGSQVIAPLPDIRAEQSTPFTIIIVDFAGPLFVKDNNAKQYI